MNHDRAGTPTHLHSLAFTLALAIALPACASTGSTPADARVDEAATMQSNRYAPAALTAADYQAAERFLRGAVDTLVTGEVSRVRWLDDGRVVYQTRTPQGDRLVVADPSSGSVERHAPGSSGAQAVSQLISAGSDFSVVESPDGRLGAFIKDHDLWVRDLESGEEWAVTEDGEEGYGYATNNAGWTRSPRPVLSWSPDSRRIFTFRHDARGVGMMYTVTTETGHPELDAWHYPLP